MIWMTIAGWVISGGIALWMRRRAAKKADKPVPVSKGVQDVLLGPFALVIGLVVLAFLFSDDGDGP